MGYKIIIYQVLPRLYGNTNARCKESGSIFDNGSGKMSDFSQEWLNGLSRLGFTHIWYTGLLRHATQTDYSSFGIPRSHPAVVKGRAGSPYAVADYYDIDPDLALSVPRRMKEFESLVQRTHTAGLKIIIDFVPNHVARQYHSISRPPKVRDLGADDNPRLGFSPANNFYYCPGQAFSPSFDLFHGEADAYREMPAKATGNDFFGPNPGVNDWYETVKLNYGVDYYAGRRGYFNPLPDTWQKMTHILLFWAKKGVDAFRCDMAEMVPAEFWAYATAEVRKRYPNVLFIGEVYNPQEYRRYISSGFDYLYDKVGMYDILRDVVCHRRPAAAITAAWQATDDIAPHMLYFLENHDEQRVASSFFASKAERGLPALVTAMLLGGNPFMIYAGEEYGERGMDKEGFSGIDGRTTIFDYWSVGTLRRALTGTQSDTERRLAAFHQRVMAIATKERAVRGAFFDLMYVNGQHDGFNADRVYAFIRKKDNEMLLVVANYDDAPAKASVILPRHAFDILHIPEKTLTAVDLLSGQSRKVELKADGYVTAEAPANGAVVMKMVL